MKEKTLRTVLDLKLKWEIKSLILNNRHMYNLKSLLKINLHQYWNMNLKDSFFEIF